MEHRADCEVAWALNAAAREVRQYPRGGDTKLDRGQMINISDPRSSLRRGLPVIEPLVEDDDSKHCPVSGSRGRQTTAREAGRRAHSQLQRGRRQRLQKA